MTATDPALVEQVRFGRSRAYLVELFGPAEVAEVVAAVEDVPSALRREAWRTARGDVVATIGEPLYRNRERFRYYAERARAENRLLYRHFRLAHERVATFFEHRYAVPVVFADDLAVPGFHLFSFGAPGVYEGGGWHVDTLHAQVPHLAARRRDVQGVVNFTVPFELPDGGSGMDLEDDLPCSAQRGGGASVHVPYRTGTMLFTESEHWHRIAPSRCLSPSQRRTTYQGHGVRLDDRWILFW